MPTLKLVYATLEFSSQNFLRKTMVTVEQVTTSNEKTRLPYRKVSTFCQQLITLNLQQKPLTLNWNWNQISSKNKIGLLLILQTT
jgi:hypothetical protein